MRGHRTKNANGDAAVIADALQIEPVYIAPFLAVPILLLLVIGMFIMTGMKSRRKRENRRIYSQLRAEEDEKKTK